MMNSPRSTTGVVAVLAALALAGCASHPKPLGPAPTAPQQPPPAMIAPTPEREAPIAEAPNGPVPGSVQDFVVHVGDRVYFDFDKFDLRDDARGILQAQSSWLQRYPAVRVRIDGNCDERGTREYNFALGARRAASVKDFLVAHGVSADRIETVSYGKERPIDTGAGDAADAHNRNAHTSLTQGAVG
ncbi:MAG TPA: peptidoglycan-associated lipoprotein Pal [Caulobacteraceae bacterium]|nr:peptidoglycan-associated lipoprotein Pal [Caulobacteraceae bacterium]